MNPRSPRQPQQHEEEEEEEEDQYGIDMDHRQVETEANRIEL